MKFLKFDDSLSLSDSDFTFYPWLHLQPHYLKGVHKATVPLPSPHFLPKSDHLHFLWAGLSCNWCLEKKWMALGSKFKKRKDFSPFFLCFRCVHWFPPVKDLKRHARFVSQRLKFHYFLPSLFLVLSSIFRKVVI